MSHLCCNTHSEVPHFMGQDVQSSITFWACSLSSSILKKAKLLLTEHSRGLVREKKLHVGSQTNAVSHPSSVTLNSRGLNSNSFQQSTRSFILPAVKLFVSYSWTGWQVARKSHHSASSLLTLKSLVAFFLQWLLQFLLFPLQFAVPGCMK